MSDQYHNFTAAGSLPSRFRTAGRYSEVVLGKDGETFPSSVKIQKVTQDDGVATLREFTAAPTNRGVLLETTPGATIDITVSATSAFYVELNNLAE